MKKYSIDRILAFIAILISFAACATTSEKQTESKDLTGFTNISFNISGDLFLTQGEKFMVDIQGDPSDLEKIISKVEDNTLIIKTKPGINNLKDVKVYVTMPEIKGLSLAGSGNIFAKEQLNCQEIHISVAGSGDINLEKLMATITNASIAGSGNINVSGKSEDSFSASIAGSGDINAQNFEAKNVEVSIAGSGSAGVFATENLSTSIVGSGDVLYKGKPLVNASTAGSGSTKAY